MSNFARLSHALVLVVCAGCQVDLHCLQCDDARPPVDAAPESCVVGSPEFCNARDDNCDGLIDEGFNFASDPFNCGGCDVVCEVPFALPACVDHQCVIAQCLPGAADLDGDAENGCESSCQAITTATNEYCDGPDCCDLADNDCDGDVGEDHDTRTDPGNCGACASTCRSFPCAHVCRAPFANSECQEGVCVMTGCRENYYDFDGDALNGCEVRCVSTGAEVCNGLDDDCDGEVDEEFPEQGLPPCGPCGDTGTFLCTAGRVHCVVESLPVEMCDGEDNDCDPTTADGAGDPEVGQPCGADGPDGCEIGTRVCVDGVLTCDEDLDPRGEPCDVDDGECRSWQCIDSSFVCSNLVEPTEEICGDGRDNDCDGQIDEEDDDLDLGGLCDEGTGTGGVGICLFGRRLCEDDEVICDGFVQPETHEICDGLDDDCDGQVDDSLPLGRSCGPHPLEFGWAGCVDGTNAGVCWGHLPLRPELCDGIDNDGDGETDEDAMCPVGGECDRANGMCSIVCRDVDEPLRCPTGMRCFDGRCVGNLCEGRTCDDCERCDPSTGQCVDRCQGLLCDEGLVCSCGRCWPPTCGVLGCPDSQVCREGRCVADSCVDADCNPSQGCVDGECFGTCGHEQCVSTQTCLRGLCVDDPCSGLSCPAGQCNPETEECSAECVGVQCLPGLACDLSTGSCVDDPCARVHCPENTFCVEGSCFEPPPDIPDGGPDADAGPRPDAGEETVVYGAGGGACFCSASSKASAAPTAVLIFAFALGWALLRRRA